MSSSPTTSPIPPRRVVIIGAGAVGAHLASSLRREVAVLVIDPDQRVRDAFAARGVSVSAPMSADSMGSPDLFQPGDVVVIATSASRAAAVIATVPASVPVVCVSNGLHPGLDQNRPGGLAFGVVEFAVSSKAPGHAVRTRPGWLTLSSDSATSTWLAGVLDPALQSARLVNDFHSHQRAKLMLNSSLDPVAAIMGGSLGAVFKGAQSLRAFRALLREGLEVARASGWQLAAVQGMTPTGMLRVFSTPILGTFASRIAAHQARAVESTLAREIARGEIGEADQLCGTIVRQGLHVNVKTPAHIRALEVLGRLAREGIPGKPEYVRELLGTSAC